jgi:hypothetical protein
MKRQKSISSFLFAFVFFIACTGANPSSSTNPSSATNTNGSGGSDASFSSMIDGKPFSFSGTDQNTNAAFHLKGTDKHIFFKLADKDDPSERLNFEVPGQQGSTTVDPASGYNGYIKGFVTYLDDAVTITITSISATRVTGTFSGTYRVQPGSLASARPTIKITDGKFDIPFSTSASWKKFNQAE